MDDKYQKHSEIGLDDKMSGQMPTTGEGSAPLRSTGEWPNKDTSEPSDGSVARDGGGIGVSTDDTGNDEELFDAAVNGKPQ